MRRKSGEKPLFYMNPKGIEKAGRNKPIVRRDLRLYKSYYCSHALVQKKGVCVPGSQVLPYLFRGLGSKYS